MGRSTRHEQTLTGGRGSRRHSSAIASADLYDVAGLGFQMTSQR
jgi:hypothetical protein